MIIDVLGIEPWDELYIVLVFNQGLLWVSWETMADHNIQEGGGRSSTLSYRSMGSWILTTTEHMKL